MRTKDYSDDTIIGVASECARLLVDAMISTNNLGVPVDEVTPNDGDWSRLEAAIGGGPCRDESKLFVRSFTIAAADAYAKRGLDDDGNPKTDDEMAAVIAKADAANDLVLRLIIAGDDSEELRQARREREAAEAVFEALCAKRGSESLPVWTPEHQATWAFLTAMVAAGYRIELVDRTEITVDQAIDHLAEAGRKRLGGTINICGDGDAYFNINGWL